MPNRHGSDVSSSEDYAFGFGGMMKDNEVNGNNNSYTTFFRQYDPRIGRWLSIDPLAGAFPWQSPYVGFDNNPIYYSDPSGAAAEGPGDPPKGATSVEKHEDGTTTYALDGEFTIQADAPKAEIPKAIPVVADNNEVRDYSNDPNMVAAQKYHNMNYEDKRRADFGYHGTTSGHKITLNERQKQQAMFNENAAVIIPVESIQTIAAGDGTLGNYLEVGATILPIGKALGWAFRIGGKASSKIFIMTSKQLQKKFHHAVDFGVMGNYSKANAAKLSAAINKHFNSTAVKSIRGTYRGNPVIHTVDPNTGLNVMSKIDGTFISGWKLNPAQLENVLSRGAL